MTYDPAIERDFSRIPREQIRVYRPENCVVFKNTSMEFGELSNMAGGFPLRGAGEVFDSAEALYQCCRFPQLPEVQLRIAGSKGGMRAKMCSKPFRTQTREDWLHVRVPIMKWVLQVKLRQHAKKFGLVLIDTGEKPIVEESGKDPFWGAKMQPDGSLVGANVLGRLLTDLRNRLDGGDGLDEISSRPPDVPGLSFFGRPWLL